MNRIDPRPATLPELLDLSARVHNQRPALVLRRGLRDDRWTYGRLDRVSFAWSDHLHERGLEPGDRILVQSPGSPTLVAAMFGAFRAGLVIVPLDAQCPPGFIADVARDTQARAMLAPSHAATPEDLALVALEPLPDISGPPFEHIVQPDDLAEIVYTSGTTSRPKGVMLTHGNITSNVRSAAVLPHGPEHRLLSMLPMSHMLEQTGGLFFPLLSGGSIAFTTSLRSSALMSAFAERRPTTLVVVPRLLDLLLQAIVRDVEQRGRLSHWAAAHRLAGRLPRVAQRALFLPVQRAFGGSLRWIFCGGAALDAELQATWRRLGITVMQGYGATECAPFVSCQRALDSSLGTVGRPLPGVQVRLADEGELMVSGSNVTSGYWHNDRASADTLHDGWYATGDLARIDEAGEIRLLGRKREMIPLPNGMNVFPADIDAELARESVLEEAAAVGWSSNGSPAVHAVLIPRPGTESADIARAIRSANSRLAPHQQIAGWSIWPEAQLPVTTTRKVRRNEIVAWLQSPDHTQVPGQASDAAALASPLIELLAVATRRPASEINADTDLVSGLGLDSLARVELAAALEQRLGVIVSDEAMREVSTVADLERLAATGSGDHPSSPPADWPFTPLASNLRSLIQQALLFPLLDGICRPLDEAGLEHVAQLTGPALLVANHTSHLDASLVLRVLPPGIRKRVAVAAARDYFFSSVWRALPAQLILGAFPLARTGPILPSMEHCGRLADRGRSILIFPEGTRSTDGRVHEFKAGIALLARELRIPVIPIGIHGASDRLPKGRLMSKPGPVRIRFGAPVTRAENESDQAFADRLREVVIELIG